MVVGVCRVAFSLPGNASLKGKRSVVRRIIDRTRARFNVAVAEVAALDSHRSAIIGFAVVSNDVRHVNSMLDRIASFMSTATDAVFVERALEIIHSEGQYAPLPAVDADGAIDAGTEQQDDDERQT